MRVRSEASRSAVDRAGPRARQTGKGPPHPQVRTSCGRVGSITPQDDQTAADPQLPSCFRPEPRHIVRTAAGLGVGRTHHSPRPCAPSVKGRWPGAILPDVEHTTLLDHALPVEPEVWAQRASSTSSAAPSSTSAHGTPPDPDRPPRSIPASPAPCNAPVALHGGAAEGVNLAPQLNVGLLIAQGLVEPGGLDDDISEKDGDGPSGRTGWLECVVAMTPGPSPAQSDPLLTGRRDNRQTSSSASSRPEEN